MPPRVSGFDRPIGGAAASRRDLSRAETSLRATEATASTEVESRRSALGHLLPPLVALTLCLLAWHRFRKEERGFA